MQGSIVAGDATGGSVVGSCNFPGKRDDVSLQLMISHEPSCRDVN